MKPYLKIILEEHGLNIENTELEVMIKMANRLSIKTHFLKRLDNPRLLWAIGKLKGIWPGNILDIGSGNGYLLWYILENLPEADLFCTDKDKLKMKSISDVSNAARVNVDISCSDGEQLPYKDNSFDAVTILEVLEHTKDPGRFIKEVLRVTRKWVIVSVPSKEDDNPEHIHLFTKNRLIELFNDAGGRLRTTDFDQGVLNHFCFIAKVGI